MANGSLSTHINRHERLRLQDLGRPKRSLRAFHMHVATSPKELTLLKAVVDQPADFERKLDYARHLAALGDARGDLLRAAIDIKTGADTFPNIDGVSQSWLDVTGVSIIKQLLEAGLSPLCRQMRYTRFSFTCQPSARRSAVIRR